MRHRRRRLRRLKKSKEAQIRRVFNLWNEVLTDQFLEENKDLIQDLQKDEESIKVGLTKDQALEKLVDDAFKDVSKKLLIDIIASK